MRRRSSVRWAFGIVVLGLVAAGSVVGIREYRRVELMRMLALMRSTHAWLRPNTVGHAGFMDGRTQRVGVGGVVTSTDGRVSIRVQAVSAARVEAVVSVGSIPPEPIALPTPGAPVETIWLPGGYSTRVLEFDEATAVIAVWGPRRS